MQADIATDMAHSGDPARHKKAAEANRAAAEAHKKAADAAPDAGIQRHHEGMVNEYLARAAQHDQNIMPHRPWMRK